MVYLSFVTHQSWWFITCRPLHALVPTPRIAFDNKWDDIVKKLETRRHSAKNHVAIHNDAHAMPLLPIPLGTVVRIQNYTIKRWDTTGIVGIGNKRDYLIRTQLCSALKKQAIPAICPPPLPSTRLHSRNEFVSTCLQNTAPLKKVLYQSWPQNIVLYFFTSHIQKWTLVIYCSYLKIRLIFNNTT